MKRLQTGTITEFFNKPNSKMNENNGKYLNQYLKTFLSPVMPPPSVPAPLNNDQIQLK